MNTKTIFRRRSARSFTYQQLPPPVAYELNELRNPLCNIYLASDMLNLTELDEEQRKYLEIIKQGATRITDMLNKIVNFPAT